MNKMLQVLVLGSFFIGCYGMEDVLEEKSDESAVESEGDDTKEQIHERPTDPIELAKYLLIVQEEDVDAKDVVFCVRKLKLAFSLSDIQELATKVNELKETWEDYGCLQEQLQNEVKDLGHVGSFVRPLQISYAKELKRLEKEAADATPTLCDDAEQLGMYIKILGLAALQIDTPLNDREKRKKQLKSLQEAVSKIPFQNEYIIEEITVNEKPVDDSSSEEELIRYNNEGELKVEETDGDENKLSKDKKEFDEKSDDVLKESIEEQEKSNEEEEGSSIPEIDPELLKQFKIIARMADGEDEDDKEKEEEKKVLPITSPIKSDVLAERFASFDDSTLTKLQKRNANLVLLLTTQLIGLAKAKIKKIADVRQEYASEYKKYKEELDDARGTFNKCQDLLSQLKEKFPEVFLMPGKKTPNKKKNN